MSSVGRVILELFDKGKFDLETAKRLINATIEGVYWCDGNEYEAAESLDGRCSNCFKIVENIKEDMMFGSDYAVKENGLKVAEVTLDERIDKLRYDGKLHTATLCIECYEGFKTNGIL